MSSVPGDAVAKKKEACFLIGSQVYIYAVPPFLTSPTPKKK